jgi:release factor glutamine methyltransferase
MSSAYSADRKDATILLSHELGIPYHRLFLDIDIIDVSDGSLKRLHNQMERLASGEPLSKIIQKKEFYGIEFCTNGYTLDPRPETELIVDLVKAHYRDFSKHLAILDLGSGTGCIGLSLLTMYKNSVCSFVDIEGQALDVAITNATQLGLRARCRFILSDWFANVAETFDIIVCNPPYVSTTFALDRSAQFDPQTALFAGVEGMDAYLAILPQIGEFLNHNGKAFIEIGFDQSEKFMNIDHGLETIGIERDLNGIQRVVILGKLK